MKTKAQIIDEVKIKKDGSYTATSTQVTVKRTKEKKGIVPKRAPGTYLVDVAKTLDRIVDKEPLFSHLVRKLVPIESLECASTGTDGVNLLWNRDFLSSITPDEQCGVLLHEVLHCAFLHLWRLGKRDPQLWNIACVRGDTKVKMADGTEKEIKAIREGEEIFGYQGGKLVRGKVLLTFSKEADTMELDIGNNRLISTQEHKILTEDGFKEAGNVYEGENITVATGRKRFYTEEFYNHDNCGDGKKIGSWLPQCGRFSSGQQVIQQENSYQSQKAYAQSTFNRCAVGVFSRLSRWRGNNYYSKNLQKLLSSCLAGCKYFYSSLEADAGLGFLGSFGNEFQQKTVLAHTALGLSDQRNTGNIVAPFNSQKEIRNVNLGVHQHSPQPKTSGQTYAKNVGNLPDNKNFEYQRINYKKDTGRSEKVYDLITDCHSYIANNIVVHNCDYAINLLVGKSFPLPPGTLLDTQYRDMSAEEIYDRLPVEKKHQQGWCEKVSWDGQGGGKQKPQPNQGMGGNLVKKLVEGLENAQKRKAEAQAKAKAAQKSGQQKESEWSDAFDKALTQQYGKAPEYIKRVISQKHYIPVINWQELVSSILSEDITDYTFSTPDRRFLEADFMLPELYSWDRVKDVIFAYDTSGSISNDDLNAYRKETISIMEQFPNLSGWAAVCDADLHSFKEIDPDAGAKDIQFRGGGGTDFNPVFEEVDKRSLRPKAMFYFTDTYGSFPRQDPGYAIFWLVHSYIGDNNDLPVPYGKVIKFMNKSQLADGKNPMRPYNRW